MGLRGHGGLQEMADTDSDLFSESLVRQQLARILASPEFLNAARAARFLTFVVEQKLLGDGGQFKEYVIAVEVFDRKESYDSREHSAVRVEAARLRQRLQTYYANAGREDSLVIELPKGGYVPTFGARETEVLLETPVAPLEPEPATKAPQKRRNWLIPAAAMVAIGSLAGAVTWWFGSRTGGETSYRYHALTDTAGQESAPSFAPSGDRLVYAKRESSGWHLFLEETKNPAPEDLTADSNADNTQPAFSPDGTRIAFRSERDGGGIFVLALKTRTITRISDFCFNPAWSPDGNSIACASESVLRPEQRQGSKSTLWTIDVTSHKPLQIYAGDAVQPSWSPDGKRIAFWTAGEGRERDIWTVAPNGGNAKPVFVDPPLDWCPRWSPDGKWLYFLSDRDGAMNLWRVRIDSSTGNALGPVESQTTPAIDMSVFSFAAASGTMVYENRIIRGRLVRIDLHSGEMKTLIQMPPARQPIGPDLSPDGQWLTFYTIGKDEEIYLVRADGSDLHRLIGGEFRSRGPRWSPDGKTIAFQSTKSGRAEIWIVQADGSQLRQITTTTGAEPIQPVWSRDGRSIAYSRTDGSSAIIDITGASPPQALLAQGFFARSWSPDGAQILGQLANPQSAAATMLTYDVKTGKTTELGLGNMNTWDPDGRHILYELDGDVWRQDIATLKRERLAAVRPNRLAGIRRSPDERFLYAGVSTIDSDLWLREPRSK